jgi:hypothetical protein
MPLLALALAIPAALALALAVVGGVLAVFTLVLLALGSDMREVWRAVALPEEEQVEAALLEIVRRDRAEADRLRRERRRDGEGTFWDNFWDDSDD